MLERDLLLKVERQFTTSDSVSLTKNVLYENIIKNIYRRESCATNRMEALKRDHTYFLYHRGSSMPTEKTNRTKKYVQ